MMYLLSPGSMLTATYDIVQGGCETHATANAIGLMDATIVLVPPSYAFFTGATTLTFVGTSFCGPGASESFSTDVQVEWWPSPAASAIVPVDPDGSIIGGYDDTVGGSGQVVSAPQTAP